MIPILAVPAARVESYFLAETVSWADSPEPYRSRPACERGSCFHASIIAATSTRMVRRPVQPERSIGGLTAETARLIAGQVCLHAVLAGTRMAAPLLALRQGYSEMAAGALVALFAVTQIFLALPAGRLADRRGLKLMVGLSAIAAITGAGIAAIWPLYPVLCLSALLVGGAVGAATIALQRHVGHAVRSPTQLKQVFSWLALGPALSNFAGPLMTGLLIDHAGFRGAYAALAALPIVAWLMARTARELPPAPESESAAASGTAWDQLREPNLRRLLLVNWFLSACWDLHSFMVPVLGHERGLSAAVIGTILGSFAIAAAAVRLVMPVIAGSLREWVLLTAAMAVGGTLFLLYPLARTPLAMGLCSALLGATLSTAQPMVMSMLHHITPRHRLGEALAMRLITVNLSGVLMPVLFGTVGGLLGASGVFWVMGAVVGAGSRLGYSLRRIGAGGAGH